MAESHVVAALITKRASHQAGMKFLRFIPASAGNTRHCRSSKQRAAVHPRERGEHLATRQSPRSSPRFIPASAGNTLSCVENSIIPPVHPRERGEHGVRAVAFFPPHGSSLGAHQN